MCRISTGRAYDRLVVLVNRINYDYRITFPTLRHLSRDIKTVRSSSSGFGVTEFQSLLDIVIPGSVGVQNVNEIYLHILGVCLTYTIVLTGLAAYIVLPFSSPVVDEDGDKLTEKYLYPTTLPS